MKSQDIGLLLKLVSLEKQEGSFDPDQAPKAWPGNWQDWDPDEVSDKELQPEFDLQHPSQPFGAPSYTARSLEIETGISKSQINLSLNRCIDVGLATRERETDIPRANRWALYRFIVHGIKYVFPTRPGSMTRGIATAFAAPILREKLMSAGENVPVWPHARGNTKGLAIEPLYRTATYAVKRDPQMYALLALVDAIRIGQPRESSLAASILQKELDAFK